MFVDLAGIVHGPFAMAQESSDYGVAIDGALSEYRAGNFEEARALFSHAHSIAPSARTARGMGMVEFELRRYASSVEWLEQSLSSAVRPLDETLREETSELLARARSFVAVLSLRVEPESARVRIDGRELRGDRTKPVLVSLGDHLLEVSADGYETSQLPVRVQGGEEIPIRIALVAKPVVPGTSPEAESPPAPAAALRGQVDRGDSSAWYESPWLWTGVSVAVAGAAVAIAFAVSNAQSDKPNYYGGDTNIVLRAQ